MRKVYIVTFGRVGHCGGHVVEEISAVFTSLKKAEAYVAAQPGGVEFEIDARYAQ